MSDRSSNPAAVVMAAVLMAAATGACRAQAAKPMESVEHHPAMLTGGTDAGSSGQAIRVADAQYELGVGDVIHISVWREPELTETAVVRPDGRISLPLAGEVPLQGKTANTAQELIRTLLLKYVNNPQVTVSVAEIHSRQVYITGQVQRPGAYPLLGSCNVLQLIASAGGLTPYAHKRSILVLDAANRPVSRFDYASAAKGDPRQSRDLQPGETVVVP